MTVMLSAWSQDDGDSSSGPGRNSLTIAWTRDDGDTSSLPGRYSPTIGVTG